VLFQRVVVWPDGRQLGGQPSVHAADNAHSVKAVGSGDACRQRAAVPGSADDRDGPIAADLPEAVAKLRQRNIHPAWDVHPAVLDVRANVNE